MLRIDPIEEAIAEIKAGKMIVLIDDDDRAVSYTHLTLPTNREV